MKIINLVIVLIISVNTLFSQKGSLRNLNNDKIINYILAGKYQNVIELTKLPSFNQITLFDTISGKYLFYNKSNTKLASLSDSLFITTLDKFKRSINCSKISNLIENPNRYQLEITTYSSNDAYLGSQDLSNTIYTSRCYKITDFKYTYSLIISFVDLKLDGISIFIQKNILE